MSSIIQIETLPEGKRSVGSSEVDIDEDHEYINKKVH